MGIGTKSNIEKVITTADALSESFLLVKFESDDDTAELATAATHVVVGVAQHIAKADERVRIMLSGISDVKVGGAVTRGSKLAAGTGGKAVKAATGNQVFGVAMKAGASGDIIPVLLAHSKA